MKNTINEFINKLLDDIHNIDPELSLKRQTEYNQNYLNKQCSVEQSEQLVCDVKHTLERK